MKFNFYIETYGCQMNVYDSELVTAILTGAGYTKVMKPEEAHLLLINTCSVRENAVNKVKVRIGELRNAGAANQALVGLLGCMATNLAEELLKNKSLSFIVGPDSYKKLPELIEAAQKTHRKGIDIDLSAGELYTDVEPLRTKGGVNAGLTIMRGCNNFCTYCVVPYARGRERSRVVAEILAEVHQLVAQGFKQVTLLGQNVNSYRYQDTDFSDLLEQIAKIEGLERIRFTSPHPKDLPDKLIEVMKNTPKICNQLHLPLQSGNSRILQKMNRHYTKEDYLRLVEKVRAQMPDITLSTDIIVGFPTETEAEFLDTMDVVKQAQFDFSFIFKYSPRKQTYAAEHFADDVSAEVKKERIMRLNALQQQIALQQNQAEIGQVQQVLVEEKRRASIKRVYVPEFVARNAGNKIVLLSGSDFRIGDLVYAKIIKATPHVLNGEIGDFS